jgi:hypothetical protein
MSHPIWTTPSGSIGTFPSQVSMTFQLEAEPESPATSLTYSLISGELPSGLSLSTTGLISGIPSLVRTTLTYTFVVRAKDNLDNIKDRYFTIAISGAASPEFTTPTGSILTTNDSLWTELPIEYSNPVPTNPVTVRVLQGALPPGLEINEYGLIRGYPEPPTSIINLGLVTTSATETSSINNSVVCLSTAGFAPNRPVVFTGSVLGGITAGQTYYVKQILSETSFSITTTQDGTVYNLSNDTGFMAVTLPIVSIGQPTIRTYSFTLKLESPLGDDLESYNITVVNQNTPLSQGGPGSPPNSRIPTVYNTRPPTYDIEDQTENFGYYVLPNPSQVAIPGTTYAPTDFAYIGRLESDNYFSFKILGHDFDTNSIEYIYKDLPLGLNGDISTGWITGVPEIADENISEFTFSVAVKKAAFPSISPSPFFNFSFLLSNNIIGDIEWITNTDLGSILNGSVSTKNVEAISDVDLQYRLVSGSLPPNLSLLSNGEITGYVAFQPNDSLSPVNSTTTFTFTIQAYSPLYSVIQSEKTFTIDIIQEFETPTENLYIKCTPSIPDRELISSLLDNETLIPNDYLYRPEDANFGKAQSVIYTHAYGIFASDFQEYVNAVTKNHYWRNITLGELETAVAKDDDGNIIYEVVYSKVIDNLINPQGISVSMDIFWPRIIDLGKGPWYTSSTEIYTSYIYNTDYFLLTQRCNKYLLTEDIERIKLQQGDPTFYTSLTPGYVRTLYPNSLPNMRNRVGMELGQEFNFRLLPSWMTSQQPNGSTLGYTPAWVICYTKPGYSETVKTNIENDWTDPLGRVYKLNKINFKIDRFIVDKSLTFNYDKNINPPVWTGLPSGTPVPDPIDSKDFYVLFPQETILPDTIQYN